MALSGVERAGVSHPTTVMQRAVALIVIGIVALAGCGRKKRVRVVPPPAPPAAVKVGWTEAGVASWYGHPYHGRASANGEIYDMEKLTAAHRTLPFETWVRVEDLDNGKTVEVRITDRGPFVEGRIIDLSHAAAREIAMIGPGTAKVRIEVIRTPPQPASGQFAVQVGAFRDRRNAERLRETMEQAYGTARIVVHDGRPPMWRVLVGTEPSEDAAGALAARIRLESSTRAAFVVRLDL